MGSEKALPVFVQPPELHIILSRPESFRQLLTVLNPFDFVLHYKVLSNAPHKFKVHESSGFVKPKCFVDVMIRHVLPTESHEQDVLRVEIYREGETNACGRKDVSVVVSQTEVVTRSSMEFRHFSDQTRPARHRTDRFREDREPQSFMWFLILTCAVSVVTVMLPSYSQGSSNSIIPTYLHPTQNLQLVAAYVLGLATMHLLARQNV
ncbi:unnamed protein product [Bursaphelenchus xylophilus]|uniref:(pine wood nematode) hypothetical protein n=1 Tax=Bursaphelenchus xylophilus TaxID=6326 RepID=A0A1I7SMV0_BURXY|nr:unnamed protein product [Bursaphelenchus xylophilus]CAG9130395.1 unnamed protein product [Bursaphelenchus xylophilus]